MANNIRYEFIFERGIDNETARHITFNLRPGEEGIPEDINSELINIINEVVELINSEDEKTKNNHIKLEELKEEYKNISTEETTCSICLEEYKEEDSVYKLKCNHVYHKKCFDTWLKHKDECCLCRKMI